MNTTLLNGCPIYVEGKKIKPGLKVFTSIEGVLLPIPDKVWTIVSPNKKVKYLDIVVRNGKINDIIIPIKNK